MPIISLLSRIETSFLALTKMVKCHVRLMNVCFPIFKKETGGKSAKTGVITINGFEEAISLCDFPDNSRFLSSHEDGSLRCVETKLNLPWCYEIDLFNGVILL